MERLIALLLAIFIGFSILTYLLYIFFKNKRYIKYFPAGICLAAGIYYIFLSKTGYTGFQDIARVILAVMFLTGALSGIATGLFLDYFHPKTKISK